MEILEKKGKILYNIIQKFLSKIIVDIKYGK